MKYVPISGTVAKKRFFSTSGEIRSQSGQGSSYGGMFECLIAEDLSMRAWMELGESAVEINCSGNDEIGVVL